MSSPAPNALWPELYPRATALRKAGLNNREIADKLHIRVELVWFWMGATPRQLGGRPAHGYGLYERARYLREAGYNIREIADDIDVPRATVGDWVRGMPCG